MAYTFDVWRLDELFCINLSYSRLDQSNNIITGAPYYIGNDGGALIVKESKAKFRELSEQEMSVYQSSSKYKFSGTETTYDFRALKISSVKRRKEKGIRIFARRSDKERADKLEKEKQKERRE